MTLNATKIHTYKYMTIKQPSNDLLVYLNTKLECGGSCDLLVYLNIKIKPALSCDMWCVM